METCRLPEDLMIDILSWLPVKSLMKFKSVCKSWYALIQDSRFVAQHHNKENTGLLVKQDAAFYLLSGEAYEVCASIDFPPELNDGYLDENVRMVASSCGIVCLRIGHIYAHIRYALWNPATAQFKHLPNYYSFEVCTVGIGIGFDVKTNDYKVVKIMRFRSYRKHNDYLVEVCSLQADTWRKVDAVVPHSELWLLSYPTYLNGFCYWTATFYEEKFLLSFDMSAEVFQKILLPTFTPHKFAIGLLNDSIALICFSHFGSPKPAFQVWNLNGDGVESSAWTKLFHIDPSCIWGLAQEELGFSSNGELILMKSDGQLIICEPITSKTKKIQLPKKIREEQYVYYKQSLVSLVLN